MSEKRWKATERHIAAVIGGRRIPVSGRGRGDHADVDHSWLSVEVKERRVLPAWLLDAVRQAEAADPLETRLPIAVVHERGSRVSSSLVVLRLGAFQEWFGDDLAEAAGG